MCIGVVAEKAILLVSFGTPATKSRLGNSAPHLLYCRDDSTPANRRVCFLCHRITVALLVVARSHYKWDMVVHVGGNSAASVGSTSGVVYFLYSRFPPGPKFPALYGGPGWHTGSTARNAEFHGFEWISANAICADGLSLVGPYWLITPIMALAGLIPWIKRCSFRFSLRTMLAATTVAAVILASLGILGR